jgi:hypothetical protein
LTAAAAAAAAAAAPPLTKGATYTVVRVPAHIRRKAYARIWTSVGVGTVLHHLAPKLYQ